MYVWWGNRYELLVGPRSPVARVRHYDAMRCDAHMFSAALAVCAKSSIQVSIGNQLLTVASDHWPLLLPSLSSIEPGIEAGIMARLIWKLSIFLFPLRLSRFRVSIKYGPIRDVEDVVRAQFRLHIMLKGLIIDHHGASYASSIFVTSCWQDSWDICWCEMCNIACWFILESWHTSEGLRGADIRTPPSTSHFFWIADSWMSQELTIDLLHTLQCGV